MKGPMPRGLAFGAGVLALMLTGATPCWASVFGLVTDVNGAVIDGAQVTIASRDRRMTVTSNASGAYAFTSLPAENYIVIVKKNGFVGSPHSVTLTETHDVRLDIVLAAGSAADRAGTTTALGSFTPPKRNLWSSPAILVGSNPSGLPPPSVFDGAFVVGVALQGTASGPGISSQTLTFSNSDPFRKLSATLEFHHHRRQFEDTQIGDLAKLFKVVGKIGTGPPDGQKNHVIASLQTFFHPTRGALGKRARVEKFDPDGIKTDTLFSHDFSTRQDASFLSSRDGLELDIDPLTGFPRMRFTAHLKYGDEPFRLPEDVVFALTEAFGPPVLPSEGVVVSTGRVPADPEAFAQVLVGVRNLTRDGVTVNLTGTRDGPGLFISPGSATYLTPSVYDVAAIATGLAGLSDAVINVFVNGDPALQNLVPIPIASGVAAVSVTDVDLALGRAADIGIELPELGKQVDSAIVRWSFLH